jgi:molecular chaperone GrpE
MRAQAEFANARKRLEKQRAEAYVNSTANLAARLLPVLDDFERALENVPPEIAGSSWLEGIGLVQRKLAAILESFNVTPIDAVGQPFDPNYHEALSQEASDELESGHVTRELQKGYKIGDRVLRPSLVYVAE